MEEIGAYLLLFTPAWLILALAAQINLDYCIHDRVIWWKLFVLVLLSPLWPLQLAWCGVLKLLRDANMRPPLLLQNKKG
jgi:hypothetical protein